MKSIASKQNAVVGLSGGVDSTAAVLLLKEKGFEVTGVYLDVLGGTTKDKDTVNEIARQLEIEILHVDVSEEFEKIVISDFCNEYTKGATPNPCIICNPEVKFRSLMKAADEIGAYHIATGHYAGVSRAGREGCFFVNRVKNKEKDQSYMLYRLRQQILERVLFPLSEFEAKNDVRSYVAARGIMNADSKDSQEICFISNGVHYSRYLESKGCRMENGDFIDTGGRIIGTHQGLYKYTVGQRKNLGGTFGRPMYVVKLDPGSNTVTLGCEEDLMTTEVISAENFFSGSDSDVMPKEYDCMTVQAKVRYTTAPSDAVICMAEGKSVRAIFKKPQRAVTPGQSIVFYAKDRVIGGGKIY